MNWLYRLYIKAKSYDEDRKYEGLPVNCRHCELLGMCRRGKDHNWRCYRGCLLNRYNVEKRK